VLAAQQAPQKVMTFVTRRALAARAQLAAATQLPASQCMEATQRPLMLLRRRPAMALLPTRLAMRRSLLRRCHRCSLLPRWQCRLCPPMLLFRR
jgi:hypothetical protein